MQKLVLTLSLFALSIYAKTKVGDEFILDGTWSGRSVGEYGLGDEDTHQLTFTLDGILYNTFTYESFPSRERYEGTYAIQQQCGRTRPIDFKIDTGKYKDQMAFGIYELGGDSNVVLMAFSQPGIPHRPVDFQPNNETLVLKMRKRDLPQQIHLAYGTDPTTMMSITWMTRGEDEPIVFFGTQSNQYSDFEIGISYTYDYKNYKSGMIHQVTLSKLRPGVRYFYRCGNPGSQSAEWTFSTMANTDVVNVTMLADINLGGQVGGAESTWDISLRGLYHMNLEDSDFVINAGDISYCDGDQICWDHHFQNLQPLAARKAYMVCAGNHDVSPELDGYVNRFNMPGPDKEKNHFYSFNAGPVHFIGFSTELWFLPMNATVNYTQQMDWLKKDLAQASRERKERPWIVVFGHRPVYCSASYVDCHSDVALILQRELEPLFFRYGVNLAYFGHIHSMERSYPISFDGQVSGSYKRAKGTVHILNGAAGQGFLGPWDPQPKWSAWRTHTHGYSRLSASREKLFFSFVSSDGVELDSFELEEPFTGIDF